MAGDPLKRVQSGQPLAIFADTWNAMIDTVAAFRAQRSQTKKGDNDKKLPLPPGFAFIENGTAGALDQFAVLTISGPVIDPGDSPEGFAERPGLTGVAPTDDDVCTGKFAILLEPVPAGAIGLGCIGGSTILKVNVLSADDGFADVKSGTTDALVSASNGPIQLLWKQSGTGDGKLAVGRWGGRAKPTKKFTVETPIDDTMRIIWTTARFTDDT